MPHAILNVAQLREWEQASWTAGVDPQAVIGQVGRIVAHRARQLTGHGDLILLLAGKGHNGDDVRAAKQHLQPLSDRLVELVEVTDPQAALPVLQSLLARKPALIVDGLFGIGLDRALDEGWCALLRAINAAKRAVLAVDVPSGLNADTGLPQPVAIQATVTLTLAAPKTGLLAHPAAAFTGRLEVAADIGLIPCPFRSELNWISADDFADFPPRRLAASHKGDYGHLAIVAGSIGYHGAAVLAARGAQRAQTGLVTVFPQAEVYHPVAAQLQSAMVSPWNNDVKLSVDHDGVLFGPGLQIANPAEELKHALRRNWLGSNNPMVVDAGALGWIPMGPVDEKKIRVMTPHPGEAARLLNMKAEQVQANRIQAVRDLSKRNSHCWVVLKGHQTLIGRSTGEIFVNPTGNPHLAQGGAGDVLAGYLAGLLAQPALQADPAKTICYAVWQHGRAADKLTQERTNWTIEDLLQVLG